MIIPRLYAEKHGNTETRQKGFSFPRNDLRNPARIQAVLADLLELARRKIIRPELCVPRRIVDGKTLQEQYIARWTGRNRVLPIVLVLHQCRDLPRRNIHHGNLGQPWLRLAGCVSEEEDML